MRLFVLDEAYPTPTNLYSNAFVHVRIKAYIERGHDVRVITGFAGRGGEYDLDGVRVQRLPRLKDVPAVIEDWRPDVGIVHVPTRRMIKTILSRELLPFVVWSHGWDAVPWWRRLYQWQPVIPFARYAVENVLQRRAYRKLLLQANRTRRIAMVFVSRWLSAIAQRDNGVALDEINVIPNPIDTRLFRPIERDERDRANWLILRPASKSGLDILVDALKEIEGEPWFEQIRLTFVGQGVRGSLFDKHFGRRSNVTMVDRSIPQREIAALHQNNGVFLCPTRQDSHGVSMCEAMASGLAVVSCANTAIPEYVEHERTGLLSSADAKGFAAQLRRLWNEPDLFLAITRAAPPAIHAKCGLDQIIEREIALLQEMAARR